MKKSLGAKTLLYPAPVLVVGTYDDDGKPNAMTAAWGGICCSVPPCIYVSLRQATYTYGSLISRKCFTVSIPSEQYVKQADYIGMASGRKEDKFAKTGLTPVRSTLVDAPYIAEFPVNLECKIVKVVELGLHTEFIGEVLDVKVDDTFDEKEQPLLEFIKPLIFTPDGQYYGVSGKIAKAFSIGKELMG